MKETPVADTRFVFCNVIVRTDVPPTDREAGEKDFPTTNFVMTLFVSEKEFVSPLTMTDAVLVIVPAGAAALTVAPRLKVRLLFGGMTGRAIHRWCW